jgi:hypothetical protein
MAYDVFLCLSSLVVVSGGSAVKFEIPICFGRF